FDKVSFPLPVFVSDPGPPSAPLKIVDMLLPAVRATGAEPLKSDKSWLPRNPPNVALVTEPNPKLPELPVSTTLFCSAKELLTIKDPVVTVVSPKNVFAPPKIRDEVPILVNEPG